MPRRSSLVGPALSALVAAGVLWGGLAAPTPAAAQERAATPVRAWLSLGPGGTPVGEQSGTVGGMVAAVLEVSGHRVALRSTEWTPLWGARPDEPTLREVGVLYGRTLRGPVGHLAAAAGMSRLRACEGRSTVPERCTSRAAMPMIVEGALSYRVLGIGLQLFATLAGKDSHQGVALFVQLGWMP